MYNMTLMAALSRYYTTGSFAQVRPLARAGQAEEPSAVAWWLSLWPRAQRPRWTVQDYYRQSSHDGR